MKIIINKETIEISSLKELEPLKQLVANNKPLLIIKAKKTKSFIFIYQIENNKCNFSLPTDKIITIPVGYQKHTMNTVNSPSAISQFKKQARRESGINHLQFYHNIN